MLITSPSSLLKRDGLSLHTLKQLFEIISDKKKLTWGKEEEEKN